MRRNKDSRNLRVLSITLSKHREYRKTRVVPEPEIYQDSIVASVRHVTLGLIRRSFPKASMMNVVYDWVGSSEFPVFFNFLQNQGQPFSHICQ